MAVEIKVPALGESVTEATVSKWLSAKRPGSCGAFEGHSGRPGTPKSSHLTSGGSIIP